MVDSSSSHRCNSWTLMRRPRIHNGAAGASIILDVCCDQCYKGYIFPVKMSGNREIDEKAVRKTLEQNSIKDKTSLIVWQTKASPTLENKQDPIDAIKSSSSFTMLYGCVVLLVCVLVIGSVVCMFISEKEQEQIRIDQCSVSIISGTLVKADVKPHYYNDFLLSLEFSGGRTEVLIDRDEIVPVVGSKGYVCKNKHWHFDTDSCR